MSSGLVTNAPARSGRALENEVMMSTACAWSGLLVEQHHLPHRIPERTMRLGQEGRIAGSSKSQNQTDLPAMWHSLIAADEQL